MPLGAFPSLLLLAPLSTSQPVPAPPPAFQQRALRSEIRVVTDLLDGTHNVIAALSPDGRVLSDHELANIADDEDLMRYSKREGDIHVARIAIPIAMVTSALPLALGCSACGAASGGIVGALVWGGDLVPSPLILPGFVLGALVGLLTTAVLTLPVQTAFTAILLSTVPLHPVDHDQLVRVAVSRANLHLAESLRLDPYTLGDVYFPAGRQRVVVKLKSV